MAMATRRQSRKLQDSLAHVKPADPRTATGSSKFRFARVPTQFTSPEPYVALKDRITYWNVAPNDKIVVARGSARHLRRTEATVSSVDRWNNRVFIAENAFNHLKPVPTQYKGQVHSPEYDPNAMMATPRPYHISNVRLTMHVDGQMHVASRVRRASEPKWNPKKRRYLWRRHALFPTLAGSQGDADMGWREVPWPEEPENQDEKRAEPDMDMCASEDEAFARTFYPALEDLTEAPELALPAHDLGGAANSRANKLRQWKEARELARKQPKVMPSIVAAVKRLTTS